MDEVYSQAIVHLLIEDVLQHLVKAGHHPLLNASLRKFLNAFFLRPDFSPFSFCLDTKKKQKKSQGARNNEYSMSNSQLRNSILDISLFFCFFEKKQPAEMRAVEALRLLVLLPVERLFVEGELTDGGGCCACGGSIAGDGNNQSR